MAPPPSKPSLEVVALVASAGGLEALTAVLRDLPVDLPAALVIAQHLGGQSSTLVQILARRVTLPVAWATTGARLRPGQALVCPAVQQLEVLPDGTCGLSTNERGAHNRPLDHLLRSLADSYGPRALAVVLTGMGSDGAAGALALKEAGGIVLAQSQDTAEQPAMPRAAVENGAAALELPLHEIAPVIVTLVAGGPLPRPRDELAAVEALFAGPGPARAALRAVDWSQTPLGPVRQWSPELRAIVRMVLGCELGMVVMWGPELISISNDAVSRVLGVKAFQGAPVRLAYAEMGDFLRPLFEQVLRTGQPVYAEDTLFELLDAGVLRESYFTYCYSALYEEGRPAGVLSSFVESTERVLAERRLATLHRLAVVSTEERGIGAICEELVRALAENPRDLPFALIYLLDGRRANLSAAHGVAAGAFAAPRSIDIQGGHPAWPLSQAVAEGGPLLVDDLGARIHGFHAGPWPEPPRSALILPLRLATEGALIGLLILGVSPRIELGDKYRAFFLLVAARIAVTLDEARARQRERERLERLAELDRVKTEFFSNVSHEFRTPLTLMLAPLEELTRRRGDLPPGLSQDVETASRNARRLLTLVNTLLDFSQLEAGRLRARFEPLDLAALTADVASVFRSAAERAGLRLVVDCPPLPAPVWVDREMWEKIVSNLLSNALKFTFEGEIAVELRGLPQHVELTVRDTGMGIPEAERPHLFKRFHRVRGTRARTHEGSGIGLALVQGLVQRHQGRIRVRSTEGAGTAFTIWLPLGRRRPEGAEAGAEAASAEVAATMAEVAARWDTENAAAPAGVDGVLGDPFGAPEGPPLRPHAYGARVLVVDDNADMRDYLRRLLAPRWEITLAGNGDEALALARRERPDLVLADVMMPGLDGFSLLGALRADEALRQIPVILLTARAGEEAAIEGLMAGADDYIAKPFSARELVARVGGQLELARMRRRVEDLSAFLIRFSDAVPRLAAPRAVQEAACRMVAERLGAEESHWIEVDWATREFVIGGAHFVTDAPSVASLPSRQPMAQWEPFTSSYLAGRAVVLGDSADPSLPEAARAGLAALRVGAVLAVPVMIDGELQAILAVMQRSPRRWTPEEVALLEGAAGRCWAEVERARAEQALRESEARYRTLFESVDEAFARKELLYDAQGEVTDFRWLEVNTAWEEQCGLRGVVGKRGRDLPPGPWTGLLAVYEEVVRTGRALRLEHDLPQEDRWFSTYVAPVLGGPRGHLVTVRQEISARKREERRQAFLLKLSDALRTLVDPLAIQAVAADLLGAHLKVNQAHYSETIGDLVHISHSYGDGLPPMTGRFRHHDFGARLAECYRTGRVQVCSDTRTDPTLSAAERQVLAAASIGAYVAMPLVKGGEWVATLAVHSIEPRSWRRHEIELVQETAERTWAAVERARAEGGPRDREAQRCGGGDG